jgi:GxxExxY protein
MNADDFSDYDYPLKRESEAIIGASYAVLNAMGHGLHEKIYENALGVEFALQGIAFEQQKQFPVIYRNTQVGLFVPDLIVFGQIIVDTKTIDRITDHEVGQMLNYLRITGLKLGLLLNFKHSKLGIRRVALSSHS